MSLRAVFFDMGGTIESFCFTREFRIKNAPIIRACLEKGGITLPISDERLADLITAGVKAYHNWNLDSMIEIPPERIWREYILADLDIPAGKLKPIGEELCYLYETQLYVREMRPEMPAVLQKIKDLGLRIGCISNTQSRGQVPGNLKQYGISEYFNPVILSSEYGLRKPDPSIFYHACRRAGVPSSACVYVGDKINRDILGARRAGFRLAVQIRHQYDDGELDEGAQPDAVIHQMEELIPLLEREIQKDHQLGYPLQQYQYKAIFFDAGDILYHRPLSGRNFRAFINAQSIHPVTDIENQKRHLKTLAFENKIARHDYYEKLVRLYGITDPMAIEQGKKAIEQDDLTVEIIPKVRDTVLELKARGYLMGIITDTALPIHVKLKWLENGGFGHIWDTVVSSREMGTRKPSTKMYAEAIHGMGLQPGQCIFVGHKTSELEGARKMGMATVAFNYDPDAQADVYIRDFSELLDLSILQVLITDRILVYK